MSPPLALLQRGSSSTKQTCWWTSPKAWQNYFLLRLRSRGPSSHSRTRQERRSEPSGPASAARIAYRCTRGHTNGAPDPNIQLYRERRAVHRGGGASGRPHCATTSRANAESKQADHVLVQEREPRPLLLC